MKFGNKFSLIFILLSISFLNVWSQDKKLDEFSFESEPIQTEKIPYFALAGGVTSTFYFADFSALNDHLNTNTFGVGEFSGQLTMIGGEGFTGLVYITNMRVGFFSYGGGKTLEAIVKINNNEYKRTVEYRSALYGLGLEYAYVPFRKFAILPGVSFGRGALEVNTYQAPNSGVDWKNYKPNIDSLTFGGNSTFQNQAETGFWFVKPSVNIEYAIANFLMFRVGASYNVQLGSSWTLNKNAVLNNVPDKISASGMNIQLGIFVGLFNY
jgi:hypothetical protein